MKFSAKWELDINAPAVQAALVKATRLGLRDTIVVITADAVKDSPALTGNNRRSISFEVAGLTNNTVVDPNRLEAAVFSTSGYGGYLETGTFKMAARPYIRPALDRHSRELVPNIRKYVE